MWEKKKVFIAVLCFSIGLLVAVAVRLAPRHISHHDHSNHASATLPEVEFNILQQPIQSLASETTSIAEAMAGKDTVLVNFWATWCAPCVHEMPLLQEAAAQHGVKTIGVSYEDVDAMKAFIERHPVSYALYQSSFDIFYFFQQQGNRGGVMPYTVLIDAEGEVVREKLGDFKTVQEVVVFATGGGA